MEATILDTSPKLALGFDPLIAAWVSRKNNAYADTGLKGERNTIHDFKQKQSQEYKIMFDMQTHTQQKSTSSFPTLRVKIKSVKWVKVSFKVIFKVS